MVKNSLNFYNYLPELNWELGIENGDKEISWHIGKEYGNNIKLNLLIYFSKFYSNYSWDAKLSIFVNPENKIKQIEKEDLLFQFLTNQNDSIAIDAFIQLTSCNPERVTNLANEYNWSDIRYNYILPTFPYKFLKQLVLLTEYCRANNIDYKGSSEMRTEIEKLNEELSFPERYKLENQLLNSLTLDEITSFEYWALINEQSPMTYSAGRILDIFYSRNWNKLLGDKKQLDCYLKKSFLFNHLGIIGTCNDYLKKFSNSSSTTIEMLKNYETTDQDIKDQIEKVITSKPVEISKKEKEIKLWEGNMDYEVKDLKGQIKRLTSKTQDPSKTRETIVRILSQINYKQIPEALSCIEDYPFKYKWEKYAFINRDWGFFMLGDFDKKEVRDEFIHLYSKKSEYQLYEYYLNQAGIDYKIGKKKLDYDKIYDLLKYDEVVAFSGGGGGRQTNEVYALIKLLELTYKTTLGYPHKLCNSNNTWGCDAYDRAKDWMKYLEDKKLLKQKHDEPISFHYEG